MSWPELSDDFPEERLSMELPRLATVEAELSGLYQLEGVTHAILARRYDFSLAAVPEGLPRERSLSALLAVLQGTSEMAMHQAKDGALSGALVTGEQNEILCVALGEDAALGVVAERGALTGLLFMAIESAARKILRAVEGA